MVTSDFRPKSLNQMAGQKLAKTVLSNIIKNPDNAPKTLIFHGAFGTGKTTSSRAFAKALNCESTHKPCLKCKSCLQDIETASYYREYDSSIIGKADRIRELRDTFFINSANGYQVIVFDEVHLCSSTAQGALLKILEEAPPRTFFILATTDPEKLLPTIRSRALEIKFEKVPLDEIVTNIKSVISSLGIEMDDEIINLIAKKSKGHMRDAHKYIDQYMLIGKEEFSSIFKSCQDSFFKYFEAIGKKSNDLAFQAIQEIMQFPLSEAKYDYQEVVLTLSKQMVNIIDNPSAKKVISLIGNDILKLVKVCVSDWVLDGFSSDMELQTTLLCVYQMLTQSKASNGPANKSIYDRAARR